DQSREILRGDAGVLDELVAVAVDAVATLAQADAIGIFQIAPQAAARVGDADQGVAILARIPQAFQRQPMRSGELIPERYRLAVPFAAIVLDLQRQADVIILLAEAIDLGKGEVGIVRKPGREANLVRRRLSLHFPNSVRQRAQRPVFQAVSVGTRRAVFGIVIERIGGIVWI